MIPNLIIDILLVIHILVLVLVIWTYRQSFLNWRVVQSEGAKRVALRRLIRVSITLGMQTIITVVMVLVSLYPDSVSRPDLVRVTIPYSLLVVTGLIAVGSAYEWYDVRQILRGKKQRR